MKLIRLLFIVTLLLAESYSASSQSGNDSSKVDFNYGFSARNYFMSTINPGSATDYYVNVTGIRGRASLSIGNSLSINSEFIGSSRIFSNDLAKEDPIAMSSSRFERQLSGFLEPMDKRFLGTIDVLNLHLRKDKFDIKIGRFFYNSPFLNKMDGRIKPTSVEGIHLSIFPGTGITFGGSYLQRFTTWGVETWKKTGSIIGHFGNGSDLNGNSFTYRDKINSDGVIVGFASIAPIEGLKVQLWNYAILDVNNSINVKVDLSKENWIFGVSSTVQRPLGGADNEIYYRADEKTNAVSLRAGYKLKNLQGMLNYTRVGKSGRFIFPREFGTESGFYTFIPRMRIEGFGDVHSWVGSLRLTGIENFTVNTAYGINILPSSNNYRLNKLGFDDYHQLMLDFRYALKDSNLNFRFLYITTNTGGRIEFPQSSFNKYFIRHFNLIVNYQI